MATPPTGPINNLRYLSLIPSANNQRPLFLAFVAALVQASVDQQNVMLSLPSLFDIDVAVGDQLDKLGAWIGVIRNLNQEVDGVSVLPDASYRILLKLFIAQNNWDGTIPGMYSIWNTVFAAEGYQILVQDNQDMSMFVVFLNPPTDLLILSILTQGYFLLRPAGVEIIGYFMPSVPGIPAFGFDVENSTVSGFDVGAWVEAIVV
jgi:Protein of unknown function (DUF2612)